MATAARGGPRAGASQPPAAGPTTRSPAADRGSTPEPLEDPDPSSDPARPSDAVPRLPRELIPAQWFEHRLQIDGWTVLPGLEALLPPRTAVERRTWTLAVSDARLTGLGWTERIQTRSGIGGLAWALDATWAPVFLSAAPAAVGLGGAVVADGPEGAAVAAPRSSWHGAGLLAGRLGASLGLALALEAVGVGLPAPEPRLAGGARSAQRLLLGATLLPSDRDAIHLTLLGARHAESPDCFRCTEAAARQRTALGAGGDLRWRHRFGESAELQAHASIELWWRDARALTDTAGPSSLELTTWTTDGAPGPLEPWMPASTESSQRTRLAGGAVLQIPIAAHRLEAGVEAVLDRFQGTAWTPGNERLVNLGGPCEATDRSGCAFQQRVDPLDQEARAWALGTYLQDSATLLPGLVARLGLRLDLGAAEAEAARTGARFALGPRMALSWDVGNRGAHWLIVEAGRSHDLDLLDAALATRRPVQRVGVWDATAGSFAACPAPAPDCLWSGGTAALAAGDVPRMDAVTLGWRGRLARRAEVGLELGWQHLSGLWAERETRLTTDDEGHWLPPADGVWRSRRVVLADPDAWRRTLSLGAWFRTRPGPFRLQGSWRVARVDGTASGPFDLWRVDPRIAGLAHGALPDDHRHRVSLTVGWLPHPALLLETRMRFVSGGPLWETTSVRGSEGRRTVLAPRGEGVLEGRTVPLRDPDVATLDVRLGFRLQGIRANWPRVELTLEALRAVGGNAPIHLSASESRLGSVLRREPPFHLAFGLRAGN